MSFRLKEFLDFNGIRQEEFPRIALYMDQLLGFFEEMLNAFRHDSRSSILTKTMVNNYVKAKALPAPQKKKYTREQMMQLVLICQLKNVLSLEDIRRVTGADRGGVWTGDVETYYRTYCDAEIQVMEALRQRLASLQEETDPAVRREAAMRLATEANLLKQAAERLIDSN